MSNDKTCFFFLTVGAREEIWETQIQHFVHLYFRFKADDGYKRRYLGYPSKFSSFLGASWVTSLDSTLPSEDVCSSSASTSFKFLPDKLSVIKIELPVVCFWMTWKKSPKTSQFYSLQIQSYHELHIGLSKQVLLHKQSLE